jgi:hypothetical protein
VHSGIAGYRNRRSGFSIALALIKKIDYRNADWALFRRELESRTDLDFSLDRVGSEADVDSMIQTFTQILLKARSITVPLVRPYRFKLTLTPRINFLLTRKNGR